MLRLALHDGRDGNTFSQPEQDGRTSYRRGGRFSCRISRAGLGLRLCTSEGMCGGDVVKEETDRGRLALADAHAEKRGHKLSVWRKAYPYPVRDVEAWCWFCGTRWILYHRCASPQVAEGHEDCPGIPEVRS